MQLKDSHIFRGLNSDDSPGNLPIGDYPDMLNMRTGGSNEQHGVGPAETLQGEIPVLFEVVAEITYYGSAIGGNFIYSGYEEVLINGKVWMKKNWDYAYPGSKAYDDDEDNADVYGRLYTHDQIMAADFCPPGWHVPTEAEWDELLTYLGGVMIAGGKLKETGLQHWQTPNTDSSDIAAFTALPGGKYDEAFSLLQQYGMFWMVDDGEPTAPVAINGSAKTPVSFVANWLAVTGVTGYYLDVATDAAFTAFVAGWNNLDVGKVLSYEVTGLNPETNYYYRVRAYNEVGSGESSNVISTTTTTLLTINITTSKAGVFTIILKATSSSVLTFDWGDGAIEDKTVYGLTTVNHAYAAGGSLTISNPTNVYYIDVQSMSVESISIPKVCTGLKYLYLMDNPFSTFITHPEWSKLEYVDMTDTEITNVIWHPEQVKLAYMNFYHCKLTSFVGYPEWSDLYVLSLGSNYLTSFIGHKEWTKLVFLNLDDNNTGTHLITFIAHPEWTLLNTLYLGNNKLTTFTAYNTWVNLKQFTLTNNNVSNAADINAILIALDEAGMSDTGSFDYIEISMGTNAAPTGLGIVAKNNLIARGVTVTTN